MAGQPLDPRTLTSWEDAFQHPLPVVRRLETHLRKNIDDNRQKLRVLVGASYRELLGTAERIIQMDEQMQQVEGLLGEIGRNCNGRAVERLVENQGRLRWGEEGEGRERSVFAQMKVLKSCLVCATRIVRARGDALQAAKLFVVSRLLHKAVAGNQRLPAAQADLRRRLHSLRNKLLSYIQHDMAKISTDTIRLPHTLCAYVLVASSTPKDALRHFLQVRYDQLDRKVDSPSEADVLESLALYGQTLIDTRELFPRKVADVLGQLSRSALLQNEQVISLVELNLDIYRSWIPEDIRTFTPWVRHDHLVSSEVGDALAAWTEQARPCLLERLSDHLSNQTDARAILESRHRFISRLLVLNSRVKNVTSAHGIEQVRAAFLSRLAELAERAASVKDLALDDSCMPDLPPSKKHDSGIWALASEDFDLSNGGIKLRRSILAARHGRNESITGEIGKLDDWTKRVNEYLDIADDMASTKWEDDLDFDAELSGAESLQHELAKYDPELLRSKLRQAIQTSLKDITEKFQAIGDSTKNPAFYVRVWREFDLRRRTLESRLTLSVEAVSLTNLYRNVGGLVVKDVVQDFVHSITASASSTATVALWDGSPPLPVQCSPQAFRFLTRLHQRMASWGADLWTAQCVAELQAGLLQELGRELQIESFTNPVDEKEREEVFTNGHSEAENADGGEEKVGEDEEKASVVKDTIKVLRKEQVVQNLFDSQYLLHVLRGSSGRNASNADSMIQLIRTLRDKCQLDEAGYERLKKSTSEFWKKTYLLFGLLAPAGDG